MVKRSIIVAGFVVAAVLLAACGETSNADPTPVQTWKITPASGGGVATATPPAAEETPTQPSGNGDGETVLQLVGANTLFDKDEASDLTARQRELLRGMLKDELEARRRR